MKGFRHFFSMPPLDSSALKVSGIGVQEPMRPCIIDRPTGTGDHLFMQFHNDVWIVAGDAPVCQPAGTLMLWTPGTRQYYGHPEKPFTHSWIHCDGTFIRERLRRSGLPANIPFSLRDAASMERPLLALYEELGRYVRPDEVIVRNLLTNWFRETARARLGATMKQEPPAPFRDLRHFIESEFAQPMTLAMLARKVNLSVPHFCSEFHRYFGTSPIDYLIRHRMHQAAYLLKDRNLRVSDVAPLVGYDDVFHFSKLFKKHFGVSPRATRSVPGGRGQALCRTM